MANGNTVTFACGISEGETLEGDAFTDEQKKWLNSLEHGVNDWIEHITERINQEIGDKKSGDRVDGYDRDDIGESPDY